MTKILLTFSIILFACNASLSCSCYPISIKDNYDKSSFVFKGKVVLLDTVKQYGEDLPRGAFRLMKLATFTVEKIYKGHHTIDSIQVVTGAENDDCGFEFSVGTDYLLYTVEKNYRIIDSTILPSLEVIVSERHLLYTDFCDRTTSEIRPEVRNLKKHLKTAQKREDGIVKNQMRGKKTLL